MACGEFRAASAVRSNSRQARTMKPTACLARLVRRRRRIRRTINRLRCFDEVAVAGRHLFFFRSSAYAFDMCGKFTQMMSWGTYVSLADVLRGTDASAVDRSKVVSPMRDAFVVRLGHGGGRE